MRVLDAAVLRATVVADRCAGATVGLVPTMGALHAGHASLLARARRENDRVVLSIFVNPLQFGPGEDLDRYPRDLQRDLAVAASAGVDYVFAPAAAEVYPHGEPATRVDVGPIGGFAEGAFRPGHFSGVATVCLKLFHVAAPTRAYFGQKDAQQLAVVRQMVADLDVPVEIVVCPTVREPDGLAMSSRNRYLDPAARAAASVLARALARARQAVASGERSAEALCELVRREVATEPSVELQYVTVADPATFQPVARVSGPATVALAALVGGARLIDNEVVGDGAGGEWPPAPETAAPSRDRETGLN